MTSRVGTRHDADPKLSVLHVVSYFPPDGIGGVGEVVAHLHRALLEAGHRSRVLTSGRTHTKPDVVRIPRGPLRFALLCWRRLDLARAADVVHVHHGESIALLLLMKLLRVDTPILLTLHVSPARIGRALRRVRIEGRLVGGRMRSLFDRMVRLPLRDHLDRWALALADEVSFISRSAATDVLPPEQAERARVIYNALPPPRDPGFRPEPIELLFVGTPNVRKRIQILPFVLAHVRERRPGCRMRVIGFGRDDDAELLRWARALQVSDAFVFEGRLRSDEIVPFYRAAQVLVVPSAYEGLPMVMLEAYQNGLPCVATRTGGHAEIVEDRINGYLVEVDRPKEMAEALLRILDDPEAGRRMGAHGRERVAQRFSLERQTRGYLDVYRELCSRHVETSRARRAPSSV